GKSDRPACGIGSTRTLMEGSPEDAFATLDRAGVFRGVKVWGKTVDQRVRTVINSVKPEMRGLPIFGFFDADDEQQLPLAAEKVAAEGEYKDLEDAEAIAEQRLKDYTELQAKAKAETDGQEAQRLRQERTALMERKKAAKRKHDELDAACSKAQQARENNRRHGARFVRPSNGVRTTRTSRTRGATSSALSTGSQYYDARISELETSGHGGITALGFQGAVEARAAGRYHRGSKDETIRDSWDEFGRNRYSDRQRENGHRPEYDFEFDTLSAEARKRIRLSEGLQQMLQSVSNLVQEALKKVEQKHMAATGANKESTSAKERLLLKLERGATDRTKTEPSLKYSS
ncbi:unnamed protein product, partial [Amoebophrya sp. A120]